ncbi:MAG: gliding motility-associated C-terminal domain-containing protein [Flavobacteriales bacterium]
MTRNILLASFLLLFANALYSQLPKAAPSKVKTEKWKYSSTLTTAELYDVDRLHYMSKEDWQLFRQDPRFNADSVSHILSKWKDDHQLPAGATLKSNDLNGPNCFWIDPTPEYEHPNTIQWPGSPGNSTDNYSEVINLPFDFNYFGTLYDQVVLTTKGTIVLGTSGYIDFLPSAFPTPLSGETTQQYEHIAGFWTDFDFGANGELFYLVTAEALYVNYVEVGYWPNQGDKTNSFQMIICADGSNVISNGNNVQFYYHDMQFANSQISGAQGGLDANSNLAIIGCDRPTGNAHYSFGRYNLGNDDFNGPYGINPNQQDGVHWLNNRVIEFNTSITNANNNIAPVRIGQACDTMYMCQGEVFNFEFAFTAPESTQEVTTTYTQSGTGFSTTVNAAPVNSSELVGSTFVAGPGNIGVNTVTITGTDNGTPALTTQVVYTFIVSEDVAAPISIEGVTAICAGGTTTLTASEGFDAYNWSNGDTGQTVDINDNGPLTVSAISENGCESVATVNIDVTPYFIPPLEGGNEPIVMCPGQDTTICVLGDWAEYEWFIYPGYDGEFVVGAPLDEACTQVTGNINGNYGVLVTDEDGCQGLNIKLVEIIESFIDPINEENEGAYCDGLDVVDFAGGFSNPDQGTFLVYGLSTNSSGWQGSYVNVYVYNPGSTEPDSTYFFTTFNPFTIYDEVSIGVGDSIVVEYFANGNDFAGNTIWILNCGENTPTIIGPPLTSGILWSGISSCTTEPLLGQWSVAGPEGWNLTETQEYNTTFTPGDYGLYTLCFNDPACSIDHCYELEYTEAPSLTLTPDVDVLLCDNDIEQLTIEVEDIGGTGDVVWTGQNVNPDADEMNAVAGPYSGYITTTVQATITNGCGSASASIEIEHQPDVPNPLLNDEFLCNNGQLTLDPIPSNQDNPNLVYQWSPGNQTTPTLVVTASGTYSVVVSNECDDSPNANADITLVPAATVTSNPNDVETECSEGELTLTVQFQEPNNYSIEWSTGEETNSIAVDEDGEYCWTVTDNFNCGTEVNGCTEVNISSVPVANGGFSSPDVLCPSECMELPMNMSGEDLTFVWTTSCSGYPTNQNDANFNFCADNVPASCLGSSITVTGTASNICGSDQATFVLLPDVCALKIPNIITANTDNLNDFFYILGLENYSDVKLNVFNRWGQSVYESSDYKNDWYPGELTEGTYYYTMTLPFGTKTEYEGFITLLK